MSQQDAEFYAQTYDVSVPDWPGELDFYRALAAQADAILEVACGTGRIAIRLAQEGVRIAGLDLSAPMLEVARQKSIGLQSIRWVQADMRSFELDELFALTIIPGHAFQNLMTCEDQVACLACIKRHLKPGGMLVVHLDHQDIGWLGELCGKKGGVFEAAGQFQHPLTGRQVRTLRAWSYERSTQTAIVQTVWEEIEADGQVVDRRESGPIRLHCLFRFEMEHLLIRADFTIEAVYGDFLRQPLQEESTEMIWVARAP